MATKKKCKSNLVFKAISAPLNLCGRTLLAAYDTCAAPLSFLAGATKKASGKNTHQQSAAIVQQIQEYRSDLEGLCTSLGSEIYHADKSEEATANVKIIQDDIETLKRIIALLEKKLSTLNTPEQKQDSDTLSEAPPAEPEQTPKAAQKSSQSSTKQKQTKNKTTHKQALAKTPTIPAGNKYTPAGLNKMLKNELLAIAKEQSITCNDSMTKNEIISLLTKKPK
nr:hypothetical protein [Desulfobulbaceae bacterium]